MKDRLELSGVSCRCRIGVPAWERKTRQKILIDLEAEAPLRRAGRSDDLRGSIDYHALETTLRAVAERGERKLLESLAEDLASAALAFDARITLVRIAAHKTPKLMPKTARVTVRIERAR
ncbi:MAG: dihydroneopterin aldolase [Elusimicrobia bacterium CG_4_9_14_3_um_filter_62_55]|nr:MAG: dihydroneopterin aldolase [Elusimicrobia bacterium CG22_combo_CG10-13_8_21_14_all_63_91]PJA14571.1 MAG: dihydroneopterin aldolase [Elusimicrobia bacterium CG_4_10_14_0_2_um_filter_63_34]PJB26847.1 MAG: dihydroneopterin aldolase [Elusimicrobia bacterium CG_4_9_14_3_um_filter_62_55]